ncbi:hypothetical protein MKZ38_008978 [Zalerion maritima]|uniref:Uncharacterized protein n=1 Tax=Zalerion maritima TaxID=339359 RepID=A0AAD5RTX8_9PEZI|nr:hypothetical protein MKZ38_008978 [Zalerion maritima]
MLQFRHFYLALPTYVQYSTILFWIGMLFDARTMLQAYQQPSSACMLSPNLAHALVSDQCVRREREWMFLFPCEPNDSGQACQSRRGIRQDLVSNPASGTLTSESAHFMIIIGRCHMPGSRTEPTAAEGGSDFRLLCPDPSPQQKVIPGKTRITLDDEISLRGGSSPGSEPPGAMHPKGSDCWSFSPDFGFFPNPIH